MENVSESVPVEETNKIEMTEPIQQTQQTQLTQPAVKDVLEDFFKTYS